MSTDRTAEPRVTRVLHPAQYVRLADEANAAFQRRDVTVSWVLDALHPPGPGVVVWTIDEWIRDRAMELFGV